MTLKTLTLTLASPILLDHIKISADKYLHRTDWVHRTECTVQISTYNTAQSFGQFG